MIKTITGSYTLDVDTSWRLGQLQEIYLQCDTSLAPVTIDLFEIADLEQFWNVKIFITDVSGNASANNITINAGGSDEIDESGTTSLTIATDGASISLQVVSDTKWLAIESTSASVVTPTTIKVIITSAQILNMGTSPIQILPQPGVNKYYDIEQIVLEVDNANYTFGNNFQFEINKLAFYFSKDSFTDTGNTIMFTGKNPQSLTINAGVLVNRIQIGNFPIKLTTSTAANPTGGTGKANVSITYTIREFGV